MAKRRDNHDGSIRQRGKIWEGQVVVPGGKRVNVYGKSKVEVKAKIKDALAQAEIDLQLANPEMTVKDWLMEWLDLYRSDIKRGTRDQCDTIITLHLVPAIGDIVLKNLTASDIQRLIIAPLSKTHAAKTVHNIFGVLHKALNQAVKLHYSSYNVADGCVLPRIPKVNKIKALDKDEIKRLLASLEGDREEFLFKTALATGLRSGELIGLTWNCIDFDAGIIRIVQQMTSPRKKGESYEITETKSSNCRVLSPAPIVFEWLSKQKEKQKYERQVLGKSWNSGKYKDLVFTMPNGQHYTQSWVYKMFQRVLRAAELDHFRVHDLRHTYVVDALRAGDDVKTIQTSAGHYSSAFTLDRYAHVTATMRKESAARMQAFLDSL